MSMTLYSGERVSLESGAPTLHSIGVALGRIPRFCGHTKTFYPVLAHVLTVAALMPAKSAIHGLMHDTQEVLFADVPTPMKSRVARNREHRVLARIYESLDLALPSDEEEELVEEADHMVLYAEAHVLQHKGEWGTEFDARAGALTRAHMRQAVQMLDADFAANLFLRKYKLYRRLAA